MSRRSVALVLFVSCVLALIPAVEAGAATTTVTSTFAGTISSTMTVNNGTNTGSIPAGTPYTGTLTFDGSQAPAPVAYGGGTHTAYTFTNLAFTIGSSTANSGPGTIDVYDNLTSASGYPNGDSVYVNFAGVAPSGLLAGAAFNWMGLALLDPSGVAVTGGALPADLSTAAFPTHFSEFNFGTRGTPWGAGNTSMIQTLSTLSSTGGTTSCAGSNAVVTAYVARNPGYIVVNGGLNLLDHLWTTNLNATNTTFLGGLVNWYQTGLIVSYTGTTDPNGCILDHLTVSPAVTVSTSSLPAGTAGLAYQADVTAAWGVAPYTLGVSGLPAGLSFDGARIIGTPAAVGTFTVHVTAADANGVTAAKDLVLTVADQPITFAPVLASGTVGTPYSASLSATGFGPFTFTATGLPAGLTLNGSTISGTPSLAGSFNVGLTATDAAGATVSASATLSIAAGSGSYTVVDEGRGKITAIGPNGSYLMVGGKTLIWDSSTRIIVNTPNGERNVIDGFVTVGMKVQWKGLRDKATNTVLTRQLEIN